MDALPLAREVAFVGPSPLAGTCFTCGQPAKLTWAHIPAQCVGNVGSMRPLVDIDPTTRQHTGRLRYARGFNEGGLRRRTQCKGCNGLVSCFDQTLKPLWHWGWHLRQHVLERGFLPGQSWPVQMPGIDPGAVIRSIIGGFTAVNDEIRMLHPELVDAVLLNTPARMPPELLFGIGLHVGWSCQAVGGYDYYSEPDSLGRRRLVRAQLAGLCFPPFTFVLRKRVADDAHFDVGGWLQESAGKTREVSLIPPVLRDEDLRGPHPVPEQLVD